MTLDLHISEIRRTLGLDRDIRIILSSSSLLIIIWFYFFVAGSALQTKTYILQHRVSYELVFTSHIFNQNVDSFILIIASIIWFSVSLKEDLLKLPTVILFLAILFFLLLNHSYVGLVGSLMTLPLASLIIIADRYTRKKLLRLDVGLLLRYLAILAIIVSSIGLVTLFEIILTGSTALAADEHPYALYHQLLSLFTPVIVAALAFCVPLKVILTLLIRKIKVKRKIVIFSITQDKLSTKKLVVFLTLCVILGVTVAFIPHLSTVNPYSERLGVDTPNYTHWLELMNNETANPVQIAFTEIASGDRPLTMLLLFTITKFTNVDSFQLVEYSPLFLTPVLILVTFFFTRQLTSNDKISVMASFLSAISFQTLIGIYSGFYANWLALILGYLGLIFLLKCLKQFSIFNIAVMTILITCVLLAHVYTWSIIISVAFVFLIVLYILNYCPRKHFLVLCVVLSSSIAVDALNSLLTGSSTGIEADVSVGIGRFGIAQFNERFGTLADTVMTYYGGAYANIAILGLVIYWLFRCQVREISTLFLLIFMSTSLIPLFLGDWVLQSRVLYDIPFQIPAAISLYTVWKGNHKLVFFATILIATYLSFHVLGNLGYIPSGI